MRALLGALLFALPLAFGSAACASGEAEPERGEDVALGGGEEEVVGDVSLAVSQCGPPLLNCGGYYQCVCRPPLGPDAICQWKPICSKNPPDSCGGNQCP